MSSKSDNDNRSNQLNPNNDAYYSSRGTGRYDDEDDDFYRAPDWNKVFKNEINMLREIEMRTPINEEFTFDFISMNGEKAHIKATAQLPYKNFGNSLFTDCTDLIDKILYPRLRTSFEKEAESPIVFSQVRNGKGNELIWLQTEYRPRRIDKIHDSLERQQEITQLNELWERSTKFKVEDFKKILRNYNTIPREDVGFIITHANYRKVRGF